MSWPCAVAQGAIDIFTKYYVDGKRQIEYFWVYSRSLTSSRAKSTDRLGTSLALHNFHIISGTPDRFSTTQSDIVRACEALTVLLITCSFELTCCCPCVSGREVR
jgi:hypothetical protein